jgi:predicted alpha/beta hydrolase family esterase
MWKLFIFTHGMRATPLSDFIPNFRRILEERGHQTLAPEYPHPHRPVYSEWKATFQAELAKKWNQISDIVLIGHSLGGYFVLRLVGESAGSPWAAKLRGIVLVAPASKRSDSRSSFYNQEIDWDSIRRLDINITHLFSKDDTLVPRSHQDYIADRIGSMPGYKFRLVDGYEHFRMKDPAPVRSAVFAYV